MPYEVDLLELTKVRKQRDHLQRIAYLFERFGGNCIGECNFPVHILCCEATGDEIVCCDLIPIAIRYRELRQLEKVLDYKVSAQRRYHSSAAAASAGDTPGSTRASPASAPRTAASSGAEEAAA